MSRRVWFARDCWLTADEKVELLGLRFGAGGVLGYEEVLALAKLANEGGRVHVDFSQLARRAFLKSAKEAQTIVSACADLGLLKLLRGTDEGVAVELPRYSRWQVKDPTAADRQAKKRSGANGNHAGSHGDVTEGSVTES